MIFGNYLKEQSTKIDQEVKSLLNTWTRELEETTSELTDLNKLFVEANFGGKRIRGALILLSFKLFGGSKEDEALKIASVYEIFHTSILIQDDVVDQSDIRRDKKTIHSSIGNSQNAQSQALFMGDIGFFLSFKLLSGSKLIAQFSDIAIQTTIGQLLELRQADPVKVALLKTARYTFSGPLQIGAILAGASKKSIDSLLVFGDNLGIAYQIKDDILDNGDLKDYTNKMHELSEKARRLIPEISQKAQDKELLESLIAYLLEREK